MAPKRTGGVRGKPVDRSSRDALDDDSIPLQVAGQQRMAGGVKRERSERASSAQGLRQEQAAFVPAVAPSRAAASLSRGAAASVSALRCGVCRTSGPEVRWGSVGPREQDGTVSKPACEACWNTWKSGWAHRFAWGALVKEVEGSSQMEADFRISQEVYLGAREKDCDHSNILSPNGRCLHAGGDGSSGW